MRQDEAIQSAFRSHGIEFVRPPVERGRLILANLFLSERNLLWWNASAAIAGARANSIISIRIGFARIVAATR